MLLYSITGSGGEVGKKSESWLKRDCDESIIHYADSLDKAFSEGF